MDLEEIRLPADFARVLDGLRRASGMSYRRLAAITGVPFNTIAGWCSGRHLPQQALTEEFLLFLNACGVTDPMIIRRWRDVLTTIRSSGHGYTRDLVNPYLGLTPFRAQDAELFFGRDDVVERLVDAVVSPADGLPPVLLVGPSGSGKSSVLHAGLIPSLTRTDPSTAEAPWQVLSMAPGTTPLTELAAHTARLIGAAEDRVVGEVVADPRSWRTLVPARTLVVIDQFEELFTMCRQPSQREGLLEAILEGAPSAHDGRQPRIVLSFRADFYDRALREPRLAALTGNSQVVVGPLTEQQVRRVIVQPAKTAGVGLDDALVELLVRDVRGRDELSPYDSSVLPMLSHTLRELVEVFRADRSAQRTVGLTHYDQVGGVHGAIARSADRVFETLSAAEQTAARHLFLRLVRTEHGLPDTGRPVLMDELFDEADPDDAVATAFEAFVAHRLLMVTSSTVSITHEALLTQWPRLRQWLADDRVGLEIRNKVTTAARVWRDGGHDDADLYRGPRLASALAAIGDPDTSCRLSSWERKFLDASKRAQQVIDQAQQRKLRRRYQVLVTIVVLLLVVSGTAIYATRVATEADRDRTAAASRDMANSADRLAGKDPALAAQLALAAYRLQPTSEARSALVDLSARPLPHRLRATDGAAKVAAVTPRMMAVGTDTAKVHLHRITAPLGPDSTPTAVLDTDTTVTALAFNRDGTTLVAGTASGQIRVWQSTGTAAPTLRATLPGRGERVTAVEVSRDGGLLAVSAGSAVGLWRLDTPSPLEVGDLAGASAAILDVAISPDGRTVATGGQDRTVRLWDVTTASQPRLLTSAPGPTSQVFTVAISPDGRTLVAGTAAEHVVYRWDITDPRTPRSLGPPLTGPASWVNSVAFSDDGSELGAASSDSLVWRWDTATWRLSGTLPHSTPAVTVAYRDKATLTTLAGDGVVRTWNALGPARIPSGGQVFSVSFDDTGRRLAAGVGNDGIYLLDTTTPSRTTNRGVPLRAEPGEALLSGASVITADGNAVLAGSADGSVAAWDVTTPERPVRRGPPVQVASRLIQAIARGRDGRVVVSSDDATVNLLDVSGPKPPRPTSTLTGPTASTFGVRISPDGRHVIAGNGDGKGYLWDIADPTHPRHVDSSTDPTRAVVAVAYNARGTLAAFGGTDFTVRLIDLNDPDRPAPLGPPLIGPVDEVLEIAFHPHRDVLAVSSSDGSIRLWDLEDPRHPRQTAVLRAAQDGLLTVAYSPDGRTLAAGTRDGAVLMWDTDPESVAQTVCATVGEHITASEWARFVPDRPHDAPCD